MWNIESLSVLISLRRGGSFRSDQLSNIAFNFLQNSPTLPLFSSLRLFRSQFQINRWELDHYSYLLAEKWVEEIGLHYSYYISHVHPPFLRTLPPSIIPAEYMLTNKRFSGDVSGVIGETLYLAYIEKVLGLSASNTMHLRFYKGITGDPSIISMADFYTIPSRDLRIDTIEVPANSVILGEAKACTNPDRGDLEKRLEKAYCQIENASRLLSRYGASSPLAIISLAIRDFKNMAYKLFATLLEV